MKKSAVLLTSFFLVISLFLSACASGGKDSITSEEKEKKKLEFFHGKVETAKIFEELIEEFEKENPDIDIEHVYVPYGSTVLKTRIARGDIPDIFVTYPIEYDYLLRVEKGYLLDLTNEAFVRNIQPEIQNRYLVNGRMYGVALSQNAVGIIYNKDIFEELNLEIPRTWDKFIQTLETIKKAGKQPILMANKDPVQISVFNLNLVANEFDSKYWDKVNKEDINITNDKRWMRISKKMLQVLNYVQRDSFSADTDQVKKAFANGEGAMYIMGTWALPDLEELNSNLNYGIFPFPATNDSKKNNVLGGVDAGFAISADTPYPEAAKRFLAFIVETENAQKFSDYEGSISAVKGVQMKKQEVKLIDQLVKQERVVNWPNHYWLGGTAAEDEFRKYSQQFFIDRNVSAYLENIEKMFSNYRQAE
ncbi:ABC transporter substrate-binding protein [Priestia abyssalis]|uniref:ABC transporter substrate-binding protein n=1 Tax=Priestia abyssalis TaxID=1221450 RepID=UPI0014746E58|nr:extracellular solute-binding protein [Priestia abyssalis]